MSRRLRPTLALIDPAVSATLPASVVAASGFDLLSHALESCTAAPFTRRRAPEKPGARPTSQAGAPLSDVGCVEALKRTGEFLVRAVPDPSDQEARHEHDARNDPRRYRLRQNRSPPAPADGLFRGQEDSRLLGADLRGVSEEDTGEGLVARFVDTMRDTLTRNGLRGLGSGGADTRKLTNGARARQRPPANSPLGASPETPAGLYCSAGRYW